jgi:O-methyltransferase
MGDDARARVESDAAELYLALLKKALTRSLFLDEERWELDWTMWRRRSGYRRAAADLVTSTLRRTNWRLVRTNPDPALRAAGRDWPPTAETMIGAARLDNLHRVIRSVIDEGVAGDLIETGVWRGGATILMRAALAAYGDRERTVWVADSFRGLPKPDARYPADSDDDFWSYQELAVSVDEVRRNFERYDLLDDRVQFLVGWFEDTLPNAPIDRLAVLRLDGDMYSSTIQVLTTLYPRLSPGGLPHRRRL